MEGIKRIWHRKGNANPTEILVSFMRLHHCSEHVLMHLMCFICQTFLVHNLWIYKAGTVGNTTDARKYKIFVHRVRLNLTARGTGEDLIGLISSAVARDCKEL